MEEILNILSDFEQYCIPNSSTGTNAEETAQAIQAYANKQVVAELERLLHKDSDGDGDWWYIAINPRLVHNRIKALSSSVALSPPGHTEGDNGSSKPSGERRSK